MTVKVYMPDGTVKVLDSTKAQRAVDILRARRAAEGPSPGAQKLKAVLDELDEYRARLDREAAEARAQRKNRGPDIDLAWLLGFPFSLFW